MITKRTRSRGNARGSVLLICFLFLCSAGIRIGSEAGQAFATEVDRQSERQQEAGDVLEDRQLDKDGMTRMLAAFEAREARIERLEREIEQRKKALEVADQEIAERLAVLKDTEETLRDMLAIANTAAEEDVATLTAVYENMKAKEAAALFEEMDPSFAAGFLGRMRPDAAAGIMAGLTPETAHTISVILAGRNAEVLTDDL